MALSENKLIERYSSDNSAETKSVSYNAEVEDLAQFAVMTGLVDGTNAVLYHGFKKENIIPTNGTIALDAIFTYPVMWHLAGMRADKFKQRNDLLNDKNTKKYYPSISKAIYLSLNAEEKNQLMTDFLACQALNKKKPDDLYTSYPTGLDNEVDKKELWFIIQLLRYNAKLISPENPTIARTQLENWNRVFERAKKRKEFAVNYYQPEFEKKFSSDKYYGPIFEKQASFEDYQHGFVWAVLREFSGYKQKISATDAKFFIGELTRLEISHDDDKIIGHQKALLAKYQVPVEKQDKALSKLREFYEVYHELGDKNDQAFYRANMRGIQEDEQERTKFKTEFFSIVRDVSAVATLYSASELLTNVVMGALHAGSIPFTATVFPLFFVGTTSLIDEATDLRFKYNKYKQSKKALEHWESQHKNLLSLFPDLRMQDPKEHKKYSKEQLDHFKKLYYQNGYQATPEAIAKGSDLDIAWDLFAPYRTDPNNGNLLAFCNNAENLTAIKAFYLGAKKENEEFDKVKFGLMYLRSKYHEHKDLKDRLRRREIKLFQSCCSFTGVFFGVLISFAVSVLTMTMNVPDVLLKLGYAGFATIGMAAIAGGVMVKYQMGQNQNKITQGEEKIETSTRKLLLNHPGLLVHEPASAPEENEGPQFSESLRPTVYTV